MLMNFTSLLQDTICDCLTDAYIDNTTRFAIKTNKNVLREADFRSYWEKGRRLENVCADICSLKGQSINVLNNDEDYAQTIEIFKSLFPLAPGYRPHCTVITLGENSGLVKSTPLQENPLHYDFFKSDQFILDMVQFHSSINLADV